MITFNGINTSPCESPIKEHQTPCETEEIKTPKTKTPNEGYCKSPFKEKNELRQCNNRLQLYISSQRSKEQKIISLENQIIDLNNNLALEKERIRNSTKESFDKLIEEKNDAESKLLKKKTENEKLKKDLNYAENDLASKRIFIEKSEKTINNLIDKQKKDMSVLNRLNKMAKKYKIELEKYSKEVEFLKKSNKELTEERNNLAEKINALKEKKDQKESDLQFKDKTYKETIAAYENDIKEMTIKMTTIEENLREDFVSQLNENTKMQQKSAAEEKQKQIDKIKKFYEKKLESSKKELEFALKDVDTIKAEMEAYVIKYEKEFDLAKNQQKTIESLQKKITELKLKPIREEQHNAHLLKLMKQNYKKKERELDDLLELKVALMIEIQSYRAILDKEEKRLSCVQYKKRLSLFSTPSETPCFNSLKFDEKCAQKIDKNNENIQNNKNFEKNDKTDENDKNLDKNNKNLAKTDKNLPKNDKKSSKNSRKRKKSPREKTLKMQKTAMSKKTPYDDYESSEEKTKIEKERKIRRSSGRPEGVPRKEDSPLKTAQKVNSKEVKGDKNGPNLEEEKAEKEEENPDCVLECYGTENRIEIKNKGSKVALQDWVLKKKGIEKFPTVQFPPELKHNEALYVYPTKTAKANDKSVGVKRVWRTEAFKPENGNIVIVNESGKEMYTLEILDREQ